MPRKIARGTKPASASKPKPAKPAKPSKQQAPTGAAKASVEAGARTKKAERAIRAGKPISPDTKAEEILRAERRLKAMDSLARGQTYAEIGAALGITRQAAYVLVTEALAELNAEMSEAASRVRGVQLQRVALMIKKYLEKAMNGDARCGEVLLKLMEREAALVGADAPKKSEVTGKDGGPFQIVISKAESEF